MNFLISYWQGITIIHRVSGPEETSFIIAELVVVVIVYVAVVHSLHVRRRFGFHSNGTHLYHRLIRPYFLSKNKVKIWTIL